MLIEDAGRNGSKDDDQAEIAVVSIDSAVMHFSGRSHGIYQAVAANSLTPYLIKYNGSAFLRIGNAVKINQPAKREQNHFSVA